MREMADSSPILEITRLFKAPRARVFEAWTNPLMLNEWWGPESFSLPECEFDVRPGGFWRSVMRSSDGVDHIVEGEFQTIEENERLSFTWGWVVDGVRTNESLVTVTFSDVRLGTRVHLIQTRLLDATDVANHEEGWTSSFRSLDALLDGYRQPSV